jgi:hypothetical protein
MRAHRLPLYLTVVLLSGVLVAVGAAPASANSQTTTNAPLTCQTRFGAQAGAFTTTFSDDVDPVVAGGAVTYRITTPFKQTLPGGLSGTYKGGQTFWHIPTNFTVTSVSTQPPPGGSQLTASASKQGNDIVVTTSGNVPIDGASHPTPDVIIAGTTAPTAGGSQVKWLIPFHIVANVDVSGIGPVDADCAPDNPNTVVGTTSVTTPGNRAPVTQDQQVPVTTNVAKTIKLLATDPDGDALTYIAGTPQHGTVSLTGANARYTPTMGYLGADAFAFTASDGRGGSTTGHVTLDVHATAEGDTYPPVVTLNVPAKGAVYTPSQAVKAAFTCADGDTGVQSCTGTVANGSAISTTLGRHTFTVTATDKGGNTSRVAVSYQVVSKTPVAQSYTAISGKPNVIPITCNQPVVPFTQQIPASVSAPTQVPEANTFLFRFRPGSMSVLPSTVATNAKYVLAPPTRGTYTDVRVVPGTGSANASNSIASIVNGEAVLTVPAVDGGVTGATFTPMELEATVRATATPPAQVTTRFDRFQVRLTTGQAGVNILTTDYDCPGGAAGAANPTLTKTTALDVTPPSISLTTPVPGGRYMTAASVAAKYTCADNHAVATCAGTVASGQPVNTATTGAKQFVVNAADSFGNTALTFASYKVFAPITINAAYTANEQTVLQGAAQYFGIPLERLPGIGVSFMRGLLALNPHPSPAPLPSNEPRPVIIPTKYLPNDAALVGYEASLFSLTPQQYLWFGGVVMAYIQLLQQG